MSMYNSLSEREEFLGKIIEVRNTYKLKLPDAIIAAMAIINNAILITADKDFERVKELQLRTI